MAGRFRAGFSHRLQITGVICTLLLYTLVCACMPAHWSHDALRPDAVTHTVTATEWLQYVQSNLTQELNHFASNGQLRRPYTDVHLADIDLTITGFNTFLIPFVVAPERILDFSTLVEVDRLTSLPYPLDHSPALDIPIRPPRSHR